MRHNTLGVIPQAQRSEGGHLPVTFEIEWPPSKGGVPSTPHMSLTDDNPPTETTKGAPPPRIRGAWAAQKTRCVQSVTICFKSNEIRHSQRKHVAVLVNA